MRFVRHLLLAAAIGTIGAGAVAHEKDAASRNAAATRKEQMPWGIAGNAKAARRTIEIAMSDDMRFTPSNIEVRQGETVKFVVRNKGKVLHEMVIGDKKTLDEHAALMARFPGMEHDEPYMAHVAAGKQGSLVWNFNRPGEFDFACLIAGHYQAGMVGKIKVSPAK
ncbi:plastocyanin [Caenimonas sedimenti]|uniref:Plastocyanin n=1 Tax=Caenimonas sedimenti TaxID=2596921 RepID=A0A562ZJW8_9BURK|nr:cupredoxin family protein [Caenimonas sedimenti]TWO68701.1 plastocyanin [Caenimonas sedimenti]